MARTHRMNRWGRQPLGGVERDGGEQVTQGIMLAVSVVNLNDIFQTAEKKKRGKENRD